jgi:MFS family permease
LRFAEIRREGLVLLVGALTAGPIGDRLDRRPLLLVSLTIFGLASLLSAVAGSLGMLSVLRFFTGVGIGGGFSGAAALAGEPGGNNCRAERQRQKKVLVTAWSGPLRLPVVAGRSGNRAPFTPDSGRSPNGAG